MQRSKGLEKSSKAKTGAEHYNCFIFSKACYCSVPQIYSYCCCNNLEIGKVIQAKELINMLQQLSKPRNCCNSLILVWSVQFFVDFTFSQSTYSLPKPSHVRDILPQTYKIHMSSSWHTAFCTLSCYSMDLKCSSY